MTLGTEQNAQTLPAGGCLDGIEAALARRSSRLSKALRHLGSHIDGRGTCLLVAHDDFGDALIADSRWTMNRDETLRVRKACALVDLRQEGGYRLAVLVEPRGTEQLLDDEGCTLALAALCVTEALAEIASSYEALESANGESPEPSDAA